VKHYCIDCHKEIDKRGRSVRCSSCSRLGERNSFYNKKHSQKVKDGMKEKAKLRDNSTYYKIPATKEIIKKRENTKRINWNKLSKEQKHKRLKNFILAGRKITKTSIEEAINFMLIELGLKENIDYKRNKWIKGYNVDFLILKNTITVDCFGDYWHKNPKFYNTKKDKIKQRSDIARKNFLENLGYKCFIFWENEIKHNYSTIKNKVRSVINGESSI